MPPMNIGTYATKLYLGDDACPSTGWHAEFGDMDNDGRVDLFIAKGNVDQMPSNVLWDPNNLLIQQADGHFAKKGDVAGVATLERSRGASFVDLNLDGRLDIIVMNWRAPMEIWQNTTKGAGNWLAAELYQPDPNHFAVGAWVELRPSENNIMVQEITVGGGHASGKMNLLHFGLGQAREVKIRVF